MRRDRRGAEALEPEVVDEPARPERRARRRELRLPHLNVPQRHLEAVPVQVAEPQRRRAVATPEAGLSVARRRGAVRRRAPLVGEGGTGGTRVIAHGALVDLSGD